MRFNNMLPEYVPHNPLLPTLLTRMALTHCHEDYYGALSPYFTVAIRSRSSHRSPLTIQSHSPNCTYT